MPKFSTNDYVYKREDPKSPLLILTSKKFIPNATSPVSGEDRSGSIKKEGDAKQSSVKQESGDSGSEDRYQYRVLDVTRSCDGGWVREEDLVALPARARRSASMHSTQPTNKRRRLTGGASLTSSSSSSSLLALSSADSVFVNESGEAINLDFYVKLPQRLQELLVDDAYLITESKLVPPIPRHPSISDFLSDYRQHLVAQAGGDSAVVLPDEVVESIVIYFNRFVDPCLLYPAEKTFFKQATKDKDPVEVYGVEHLMRFFVRWPALCFDAKVSEDALATVAGILVDIYDFLIDNETKYFTKQYVQPKTLKLSSHKKKTN